MGEPWMGDAEDMDASAYKQVRGLSRGLEVLRALNRVDGGAGVSTLADMTGIHRTTVRRLLETLRQEGVVRTSESDGSWRLTLGVRKLSEGFRDDEWVASVAAPLMGNLLKQVLWPSDLCTLDGDAMIIRESTHRFSRLSFHRAMVGRRLPLLNTAAGKTWLAFCPEEERRQLVDLLATQEGEAHELARAPKQLNAMLAQIRQKGYGENFRAWSSEGKFAALAVPVFMGENLLASLNLIFLASAMSIEEAARRYVPILQKTASSINHAAQRLHAGH